MPYLLIRIAVRDFTPATVVFIRLTIGALILIPIAIKQRTFLHALRGSKHIFFYACFEMIGPWYLITKAETSISSGLAGLLVATVPIWSSLFASRAGDRTVWHHTRLFGLIVGFIGVFSLVGIEGFSGESALWAIGFVLVASIGYAYAPLRIRDALPHDSGLAINAVAMAISAGFYFPFALAQWPEQRVSLSSLLSVLGLGVFCTAFAFVIFFIVMAEIGPTRTSFVTYLNTAFAVLLGVMILSEPITLGIIIGLPMVLVGSFYASRKPKQAEY